MRRPRGSRAPPEPRTQSLRCRAGARSAVVCGSLAGTPGWKGLLRFLLWAHGPATSLHGCHRQKGAPCALRKTAVGESLPCTGPGNGSSTMCGKSRLGIENGIVALPIFCHTRYNNAQGPVLGRSSSRIQLAPRKASVCHRVRKWRYEAPKSKSTMENRARKQAGKAGGIRDLPVP